MLQPIAENFAGSISTTGEATDLGALWMHERPLIRPLNHILSSNISSLPQNCKFSRGPLDLSTDSRSDFLYFGLRIASVTQKHMEHPKKITRSSKRLQQPSAIDSIEV